MGKLNVAGVKENALKWVDSYFQDREVVIYKECVQLTTGVPQGALLSPSLFLLYIEDMLSYVKQGKKMLFADDTTLYSPGKSLQYIVLKMNSVSGYLCQNNLSSINMAKTKYIRIAGKYYDVKHGN